MRAHIKSLQSPIILVVSVVTIAFYGQRAFGQQPDSTETNDSATSASQAAQKTDPQKKAPPKTKGFFESLRGSIDFGAHSRDLSGSKPGKFEQFKDFRNA